ncbi:hypothetical protein [Acaryochloris thomasi]|nr:hypothetical protein [Acaryochloris thomasi]
MHDALSVALTPAVKDLLKVMHDQPLQTVAQVRLDENASIVPFLA